MELYWTFRNISNFWLLVDLIPDKIQLHRDPNGLLHTFDIE